MLSGCGIAPRHSAVTAEGVSCRDWAGAPSGVTIDLGVGTERDAGVPCAGLLESIRRERVMADLAEVGHPGVFVPLLRREWGERSDGAAMRPGVPGSPFQPVPSCAASLLGTSVEPSPIKACGVATALIVGTPTRVTLVAHRSPKYSGDERRLCALGRCAIAVPFDNPTHVLG